MKLPEFDLEKYNSNETEQYRIKILSEYLLEFVKNRGDNFDDLSLLDDFQFEDFYGETVATVKRYYYTLNNWDYEKEKLMKSLTMSIARTKDLMKTVEFPNESCEQTEDEITVEINSQEEELKLLYKTYSKIKWTMLYNYDSRVNNYNKPRERKKVGYKILTEFKKLIREFRNNNLPKKRTADINYKFALLDEMGVIKWLQNNIHTNNKDRAEILQDIIGGAVSTLEDYLTGKSTVSKDVRQKALDILNEKRYPK